MNKHARDLAKTLEGLGFVHDPEAKVGNGGRAYRHPNKPNQPLKVFDQMSDNAITSVLRMGNKIADSGWSGPRMPASIRERARVFRMSARTQRERDQIEAAERAARAEASHAATDALRRREEQIREVRGLMNPGNGR